MRSPARMSTNSEPVACEFGHQGRGIPADFKGGGVCDTERHVKPRVQKLISKQDHSCQGLRVFPLRGPLPLPSR